MLASYSKKFGLMMMVCALNACSSTQPTDYSTPIDNPFGNYGSNWSDKDRQQNITLRTKRGDQAVEVELPRGSENDLVVPMNPKFLMGEEKTGGTGVDYQYSKNKASMADREIASTFAGSSNFEQESKKRDIENQLGLQQSDEMPHMDESYLAKMDIVKQLFKQNRYEASLIEIDRLVRDYPTNPRLYEMRGTVLDRMGYSDLAVKSWRQALEFDPNRLALKKWIEKREGQRSVASEPRH